MRRRFFVYNKRDGAREVQQLVTCDEVKTVKEFCYLGDRLNASEKCEAAVTERTKLGWKKFREYGEIFCLFIYLYIYPPNSQESDGGANT